MEAAIGVVIAVGLVSCGVVFIWRKGVENFWLLLAETNDLHGTCFGTSPKDKATLVGVDLNKGGVLAFDRMNRKIAYVTKRGKSVEILEYDFIKSWKITWREKTRGGGASFGIVAVGSTDTRRENVHLEIATNDINRPVIKMPMSSVWYAEETLMRLTIMINGKS